MPLKRKKRVELLFFSKEKLDVKLDVSAAQKKYPLYRLAIISLELLDRKPYEMHPSWLSFAVKLTAFLVTFCCCRHSVVCCAPEGRPVG